MLSSNGSLPRMPNSSKNGRRAEWTLGTDSRSSSNDRRYRMRHPSRPRRAQRRPGVGATSPQGDRAETSSASGRHHEGQALGRRAEAIGEPKVGDRGSSTASSDRARPRRPGDDQPRAHRAEQPRRPLSGTSAHDRRLAPAGARARWRPCPPRARRPRRRATTSRYRRRARRRPPRTRAPGRRRGAARCGAARPPHG